jgi:transcriptional regulator with PAS, ATPase and Fis domain
MKIENEYSSFEENMPVVVAATRMTNERLFNKFLKAAEDKTVIIEKEGYYKVNNQGLPAYMVLNDADLVVSNKEDIIREISEKGSLSENVTQADYSDILTKNPICFYLNLDSRTYSNEMQKFIEDEMDGSIEMGLKTFGDKLKSLSFSASLEEWELRMELTEEDEYSLYTLLSQVDK